MRFAGASVREDRTTVRPPDSTPEGRPVKCWNCGKEIPDGAEFCPSCEAQVKNPPTAEEFDAVRQMLEQMDPAGIRRQVPALASGKMFRTRAPGVVHDWRGAHAVIIPRNGPLTRRPGVDEHPDGFQRGDRATVGAGPAGSVRGPDERVVRGRDA